LGDLLLGHHAVYVPLNDSAACKVERSSRLSDRGITVNHADIAVNTCNSSTFA